MSWRSRPRGGRGKRVSWTGKLLARQLPDDGRAYDHFVCGPEPMMNMVEKALLELDVPQQDILSERFNMV